MSICVRKPTIWVPTRSDTNRAVQSQQMIRDWKFWVKKVEKLYYPCSENKGADHNCEADLCLCFRVCKLLVFPCVGSYCVTLLNRPSRFVTILLHQTLIHQNGMFEHDRSILLQLLFPFDIYVGIDTQYDTGS